MDAINKMATESNLMVVRKAVKKIYGKDVIITNDLVSFVRYMQLGDFNNEIPEINNEVCKICKDWLITVGG